MQGFSVQMFGEPRQEDHEPEPKLNRKTVNSVTTKVTNELESPRTREQREGAAGKGVYHTELMSDRRLGQLGTRTTYSQADNTVSK